MEKENKDYPLTADAILATWDKKTKLEYADLMIDNVIEEIENLEIQMVGDSVCAKFLTKEEVMEAQEDARHLFRKRGSLDALQAWREQIEKEGDKPKGVEPKIKKERPHYIKGVIHGSKDKTD